MRHAKYIIYRTRTLLFWIKKKFVFVIFFLFSFFFKGIHALWIRNFCRLHWLNVETTDFCKDEPDIDLQTPFGGQYGGYFIWVDFLPLFCLFVLLCLSMCLYSFKKIHHNTNGRFWSFLFCFVLPTWIKWFWQKKSCTIISLTATVLSWPPETALPSGA